MGTRDLKRGWCVSQVFITQLANNFIGFYIWYVMLENLFRASVVQSFKVSETRWSKSQEVVIFMADFNDMIFITQKSQKHENDLW